MARPKSDPVQKLSKRFTFRLTEDEMERMLKVSAICGKAPGTLIREKLFKGKFPHARTPRIDVNTYAELKKIGVNLNQLTWKVNAGMLRSLPVEALNGLKQHLELIIAKLIHDSQPENR